MILIEIYLKEKFKEKAVSIQDNADKDNTAIKYSQGDNPQLMRCLNLDMHHFAAPLSTLSLTDGTGSTKNAFNKFRNKLEGFLSLELMNVSIVL